MQRKEEKVCNKNPDSAESLQTHHELLLQIIQDSKPTLSDLKNLALVNKNINKIINNKSLISDLPSCLYFFFRQLNVLIRPANNQGLFGQFFKNKDLIKRALSLKEKILSVCKAQDFSQVDEITLNTFKMDEIEKFRSTSYAKFGPYIPVVKEYASIHVMYADVAERKQKDSIQHVMEYAKLQSRDEKTICLRLLLVLLAELATVKSDKKLIPYKENLEECCDRLTDTLNDDQLNEYLNTTNKGIKAAEGQGLHKLVQAFEAIKQIITEKIEQRLENTRLQR